MHITIESENFQEQLSQLPMKPGIYRFYNAFNQLLYVGKSKHLRQRVRTYFRTHEPETKLAEMLRIVRKIEYEVTDTNLEAMLLECEWIQQHKPPFNVQMRSADDYVYITLSPNSKPRISRQRSKHSIGPFRNRLGVRDFLTRIWRILYEGNLLHHLSGNETAGITFLNALLTSPQKLGIFIQQIEEHIDFAKAIGDYDLVEQYENVLPFLRQILKTSGKFQNFLEKDHYFMLKLDEGTKHFFVRNGLIQYSYIQENGSDFSLDYFLFYAGAEPLPRKNPRLAYDLQDILYRAVESREICFRD